ncbi:MAG: LysM peptidoglycan-binding domain-containing protein [Candidatus Omnitrophica bacterium]|nr:LysM peptidoglycan-binding domain-containing protein [Candidatus Omnitrophota bacterium]
MRNLFVKFAGVAFCTLMLSACSTTKGVEVKAFIDDRQRVDQDLTQGNAGYMAGTPSAAELNKDREKTRKVFVMEVTKPAKGVDQKFYEYNYQTAKGQVASESQPSEASQPVVEHKTAVEEEAPKLNIPNFDDQAPAVKAHKTETEAVAQPSGDGTYTAYTVEKDDTLQKIAVKFYKSSKKWYKIYQFNKDVIKNPDHVKAGLKIKIPNL